jgi:hypothetical protein
MIVPVIVAGCTAQYTPNTIGLLLETQQRCEAGDQNQCVYAPVLQQMVEYQEAAADADAAGIGEFLLAVLESGLDVAASNRGGHHDHWHNGQHWRTGSGERLDARLTTSHGPLTTSMSTGNSRSLRHPISE